MNINNVTILGHLTDKPVVKDVGESGVVSNFTVGVQRDYGDDTDFINVEVWNQGNYKLAEYTREYEKGNLVIVVGRLKQNKWEDDTGSMKSSIVVKGSEVYNFDNYGEEVPF